MNGVCVGGWRGNGPRLLQCVSSAGRTAAQPEKKERCVPLHGDLFYQTGQSGHFNRNKAQCLPLFVCE